MTHAIVPIIRCDGGYFRELDCWPVPCHGIVETERAAGEGWHVVMIAAPGQDLCPACWDAWQNSKQLTRSQLQNWIDNLKEITQS